MSSYLPTVTGHRYEEGELILETLDEREETDLVSQDPEAAHTTLVRRSEFLSDEQQEKLALWENA